MSNSGAPLFRTVADLDPATASALLQFGMALADTKHRLGQRLSEWAYGGAPALEAAVAAAAMTQDELGHARSLFAILRDLPGAPAELRSETDLDRARYFNPALLDASYPSWVDVIAAGVLLDQALTAVVAATRDSAFAPLAGRAGKILQEERFHRVYAEGWLARLAGGDGATRARLQAALDRAWPAAWGWFGPPDDPVAGTLLRAGILAAGPDSLRATWLGQVAPLLEKHDLAIPPSPPGWTGWEAARRQLPDD